VVRGERLREIRHRLKKEGFRLGIRKTFFTRSTVMGWSRLVAQRGFAVNNLGDFQAPDG